jgi:probable F420-dependent oxidoreductase
MDFGLALPSYRVGATRAGIEAAAETCARLGWHSLFTTDHLLVEPSEHSADYFHIFDPLITLAHLGPLQPRLRLGISVVVVPMRNALVLAKELATLDVLSGGRLICGVGVGWNRTEFGNVGAGDRFTSRGAYLDETIAIWRRLWAGDTSPFAGRFHRYDKIRFGPLPAQGAQVPIWVGGRHEAALRRAGRLGDGYHATASSPAQLAVRIPVVRRAAEAADRPMPLISARLRVHFGSYEGRGYVLAGTPEQMVAELRAFADIGVGHACFDFVEPDVERHAALMERFDREVLDALR